MLNTYEDIMGAWVRGRCMLRESFGHSMPKEIKDWLETVAGKPPVSNVNPLESANSDVLGWLLKTIEDPDWAE
ncbi:MAG: hypothetical protein ACYS0G_02895 [Planctomycetota bacterium]|jgi:hypothetical protein